MYSVISFVGGFVLYMRVVAILLVALQSWPSGFVFLFKAFKRKGTNGHSGCYYINMLPPSYLLPMTRTSASSTKAHPPFASLRLSQL